MLWNDVRFGIRMLLKHPTLSISAILTFGLGLGLTTTVFSIVNGALFKGLPFERADRLMAVSNTNPAQQASRMPVSVHDYADFRKQQSVFERLGAYTNTPINLSETGAQPERFMGASFSAEMFDVLGVRPALGRPFRPEEERPGTEPVLLISFDLWRDRFGLSPSILGRSVRANGRTATIIGVMPEGFAFPNRQKLWSPLTIDPVATERGKGPSFQVVGRLKQGKSVSEAQAQISGIAATIARDYPRENAGQETRVRPFLEGFLGPEIHAILYTMLSAALGVLLIACVNVTNLMLARASMRTKEIAVRSALGAGRRRIVMQMLTEVLLLALLGGGLGLGLGHAGIQWFVAAISSQPPPFWITFDFDYRVLLFVLGSTLAACVLSGLFPALQVSRSDVGEVLKNESRGSHGMRTGRFIGGLVIAEVALSCCLLVGAGLMIKSVIRLKSIDLPFTRDNVFTARINLPAVDYPEIGDRIRFYEQLLPKLQSIPGVEAATLSDGLPASGNGALPVQVEGRVYERESDNPIAREGIVTPGYFNTFRAEVRRGREFLEGDRQESQLVAIVNETFARTHFPDADPLGRRFRKGRRVTEAPWLTVVGVVPDMLMEGIGNNDQSPAGFYIPIAQSDVGNFVSIALRTRGNPMTRTTEVRAAVGALDSSLAIFEVASMNEVIDRATWFYSVFGTLFVAFGLAALFLAVVGLYGVMSFAVNRRRQEIGIRMALGAQAAQLMFLVMKRGVIQLAAGLGVGLLLAGLAAGPLQTILFRVDVRDPAVFGTVLLTLAAAGLLASLIPARRATEVDPVSGLTAE